MISDVLVLLGIPWISLDDSLFHLFDWSVREATAHKNMFSWTDWVPATVMTLYICYFRAFGDEKAFHQPRSVLIECRASNKKEAASLDETVAL